MRSFELEERHIWSGLVALVVLVWVGLFIFASVQTHVVKGYYLERDSNGMLCVVQSIDWNSDNYAFCSEDINRTLTVLNAANASIRGGK